MLSTPSHLSVTAPSGHAASLSLRRHLRCFGFPDGILADAPVRHCRALSTGNPYCPPPVTSAPEDMSKIFNRF